MDEAIGAAALALVGVPFRLYGRRVETGIDCVGLALLALRGAGIAVPEPPAYRLRAGDAPMAAGWMARAGLARAEGRACGDLVIVRAGPLQPHLLVDLGDMVVNAHAGLGRVVRMAWPGDWGEMARWRFA